jgi:hypothetical protein
MPHIVGRRNAADLRTAVARETAGVAAIEYADEVGVLRQLRVQAAQLTVGDRMLRRPIEIERHQRFAVVVRFAFGPVFGNSRAMSRIEQHRTIVAPTWLHRGARAPKTDAIRFPPNIKSMIYLTGHRAYSLLTE